MPLSLCWTFASEVNGAQKNDAGETVALGGFLHNLGYYDRVGAIPIIYSGALAAMIASAVIGPRYGVFMPPED